MNVRLMFQNVVSSKIRWNNVKIRSCYCKYLVTLFYFNKTVLKKNYILPLFLDTTLGRPCRCVCGQYYITPLQSPPQHGPLHFTDKDSRDGASGEVRLHAIKPFTGAASHTESLQPPSSLAPTVRTNLLMPGTDGKCCLEAVHAVAPRTTARPQAVAY